MKFITIKGNHWNDYIITSFGLKIKVTNGHLYSNTSGYWVLYPMNDYTKFVIHDLIKAT